MDDVSLAPISDTADKPKGYYKEQLMKSREQAEKE